MTRKRTPKAEAAAPAPETGSGAADQATAATEPAATAPAAPKAAAKSVRVICMARDGRRRGGRHWPEGETLVPADEMTADMRKALAADPMFQVGD